MYNMNVKMKFIEMKAAGMPMYKIAHEIGVHRITLMRWSKELAAYILIAKQDALDEILLENNCIRLKRTEAISRELNAMYEQLERYSGKEDKAAEYSKTLNNITKLTRLLMMEANGKSTEALLLDKQEDKRTGVGITGALLVTDRKKFDVYTEGDNSRFNPEIEDYKNNITMQPNEMLHTEEESIQDISDKDPLMQEIFNKSIKRNSKAAGIITHRPKETVYQDYAM